MASTLNAFLDRYRRAFSREEVAGLVELFHVPCLIMGATVHAITTPEDLRERLARQLARHRESGVAEASFTVLGHRRIEARYLTVDVGWEMRDAKGALVLDFSLMYTLTAPERGWKIVAVAPLEPTMSVHNLTGAHSVVPAALRGRGT